MASKKFIVKDTLYSPYIWQSPSKQWYVMPGWQECTKETTLDDVEYIPYVSNYKINDEVIQTFVSSSNPDTIYEVKAYGNGLQCDCPGWVYQGRNCKHVKEIKATNPKFVNVQLGYKYKKAS